MKKAKIITLLLCIAAMLVFSVYFNILGGLGIIVKSDRPELGTALLISSAFLITGTIIACFKKVWLPLVFNVIGTACYIYTVAEIYAIPNSAHQPKIKTEALAERHLLTVIVTVLLFALTVFNYLDESNVQKRTEKRRIKQEANDRELSDSEKIV